MIGNARGLWNSQQDLQFLQNNQFINMNSFLSRTQRPRSASVGRQPRNTNEFQFIHTLQRSKSTTDLRSVDQLPLKKKCDIIRWLQSPPIAYDISQSPYLSYILQLERVNKRRNSASKLIVSNSQPLSNLSNKTKAFSSTTTTTTTMTTNTASDKELLDINQQILNFRKDNQRYDLLDDWNNGVLMNQVFAMLIKDDKDRVVDKQRVGLLSVVNRHLPCFTLRGCCNIIKSHAQALHNFRVIIDTLQCKSKSKELSDLLNFTIYDVMDSDDIKWKVFNQFYALFKSQNPNFSIDEIGNIENPNNEINVWLKYKRSLNSDSNTSKHTKFSETRPNLSQSINIADRYDINASLESNIYPTNNKQNGNQMKISKNRTMKNKQVVVKEMKSNTSKPDAKSAVDNKENSNKNNVLFTKIRKHEMLVERLSVKRHNRKLKTQIASKSCTDSNTSHGLNECLQLQGQNRNNAIIENNRFECESLFPQLSESQLTSLHSFLLETMNVTLFHCDEQLQAQKNCKNRFDFSTFSQNISEILANGSFFCELFVRFESAIANQINLNKLRKSRNNLDLSLWLFQVRRALLNSDQMDHRKSILKMIHDGNVRVTVGVLNAIMHCYQVKDSRTLPGNVIPRDEYDKHFNRQFQWPPKLSELEYTQTNKSSVDVKPSAAMLDDKFRLSYSSQQRRLLEASLFAWLHGNKAFANCRNVPESLLAVEMSLRNGTLLCFMCESILNQFARVTSQSVLTNHGNHALIHYNKRPNTQQQYVRNVQKAIEALRQCPKMKRRHLYHGVEDDIVRGNWDSLLGVLEDMHRLSDLIACLESNSTDFKQIMDESNPYYGKYDYSVSLNEVQPNPAATLRLAKSFQELDDEFNKSQLDEIRMRGEQTVNVHATGINLHSELYFQHEMQKLESESLVTRSQPNKVNRTIVNPSQVDSSNQPEIRAFDLKQEELTNGNIFTTNPFNEEYNRQSGNNYRETNLQRVVDESSIPWEVPNNLNTVVGDDFRNGFEGFGEDSIGREPVDIYSNSYISSSRSSASSSKTSSTTPSVNNRTVESSSMGNDFRSSRGCMVIQDIQPDVVTALAGGAEFIGCQLNPEKMLHAVYEGRDRYSMDYDNNPNNPLADSLAYANRSKNTFAEVWKTAKGPDTRYAPPNELSDEFSALKYDKEHTDHRLTRFRGTPHSPYRLRVATVAMRNSVQETSQAILNTTHEMNNWHGSAIGAFSEFPERKSQMTPGKTISNENTNWHNLDKFYAQRSETTNNQRSLKNNTFDEVMIVSNSNSPDSITSREYHNELLKIQRKKSQTNLGYEKTPYMIIDDKSSTFVHSHRITTTVDENVITTNDENISGDLLLVKRRKQASEVHKWLRDELRLEIHDINAFLTVSESLLTEIQTGVLLCKTVMKCERLSTLPGINAEPKSSAQKRKNIQIALDVLKDRLNSNTYFSNTRLEKLKASQLSAQEFLELRAPQIVEFFYKLKLMYAHRKF